MQPIIGQAKSSAAAKSVSTATFMTDVIDASHDGPVIVDFWAPWCGPCKTLGPALEKAVAETKGAVRMVKINVDENQDLAAQMRVQSIPAVYAFLDGRPVDGFVGAVPDSQIKTFVKRLADMVKGGGSPIDDALAQAKAAYDEGKVEEAAAIYGAILQREPAHLGAITGIGRCLLALGDIEQARMVLERVPADQANAQDVVALRTGIELAEQGAAASGATRELRDRLAQNADDHQARYDLAMALFAEGDKRGAVEALLDIVKRDRTWNDDGARKQLLKFFEAFGFSDPLSVEGRRRLSTLLFS